MVYNILHYGAVSDGITLCSASIQAAADKAAENGGGTLYIPAGKYVCGTVELYSNVQLYIENGATVFGSGNLGDFGPEEEYTEPLYQDLSHTTFRLSMFFAENAHNITISGGGIIDMRSVWDEKNQRKIIANRGAKVFAFKNCTAISIKDISIMNATDLAVYLAGCTKVHCSGLRLRVHIDGISPDCCDDVLISDCDIESGDDCIAIKSSYTLGKIKDCENIVIANCILKSRCNAIKFGTESNGGVKNLAVSNCVIKETRFAGIALESVDGGHLDGVNINNILMKNVGTPIFVVLGERGRGPDNPAPGSIKNIYFSNIAASGPYIPYDIIEWNYKCYKNKDRLQQPWRINGEGFDPEYDSPDKEHPMPWQVTSSVHGLKGKPIENISFNNIHFNLRGGCPKGGFERQVPENTKGYPEAYMFGRTLPAKGLYCRNVKGLRIRDFRVITELNDSRDEIVYDNVSHEDIL